LHMPRKRRLCTEMKVSKPVPTFKAWPGVHEVFASAAWNAK
jgi:hypothetical protein